MSLRSVFGVAAIILVTVWGAMTGAAPAADSGDDARYRKAREQMIQRQIVARGVRHPGVLQAMMQVERHRFVPEAQQRYAYGDYPLPIGYGQTISQPYIVALMTAVLQPRRGQKVLEIGTGSGYQAAVLAELYGTVYTIEIVAPLGERAGRLFSDLGLENIRTRIGDGYQGWPEASPFDAIIVTCSPSHIPVPLQKQLVENGRMVIPVGKAGRTQQLVLMKKKQGRMVEETIIPVRFVPMVGPDGRPY
jgi:protein-L-isoaspartate(D-aspartate) O-methyltransferase